MPVPVDGNLARESLGMAVLQALRGQKEVKRGAGNVMVPLSGRESVGFLYCAALT
jgi:hypothetical protein